MADDGKILLSDFIDDNIKSEIKAVANEMQALVKVVSELKGQLQQSYDDQKKYVTVQKEVENVTKKIVEVEAKQKVLDTDLSREYEKKRQAHQKASKALKDDIAAEESAYKRLSVAQAKAAQAAKDLAAEYGVNSKQAKDAIATAKGLTDQLKAIDASMGNHQRNVGNYKEAIETANMSLGEMKRTLKELRNMPLVGKTEAEIQQINATMATLTDEIGDYSAKLRSAGDKVSLVIEATQGFIAIGQMATGTLAAFGVNTEKLDKAMVQLIGVSQALATVHELNEKQILKSTIAMVKQSAANVQLTITTALQTAAMERNVAINAAAASGLGKLSQQGAGVKAMFTSLGNSLKGVAAGAGATIAAVLAVVAALGTMMYFVDKSNREKSGQAQREREYAAALENTTKIQQKANEKTVETVASITMYKNIAEDTTKSDSVRLDALKKINEATNGQVNVNDLSAKSLFRLRKETEKYIQTIMLQAEAEAIRELAVEKYKEMLDKQSEHATSINDLKKKQEDINALQKQFNDLMANYATTLTDINENENANNKALRTKEQILTSIADVENSQYYAARPEAKKHRLLELNAELDSLKEKEKQQNKNNNSTNAEATAESQLEQSLADVNEQYKLRIELAKNETVPKQQLLNLMDAEIEKADGIYRAYEEYYKADKFYSTSDLEALRRIDAKTQALKKQRDELEKLTTTETISKTGVGIEGFTPRDETVVTPAGEPTFLDKLGSFSNELDVFWEKYKEDVTKAYTSIGEVISNTFERQSMYLDQQQKETDSYYDNLISNYKDDEDAVRQYTAAKERADEDYDTKRRAIAIRQARFEKAQALLSIAIDTSKAIMKAWAESPKTAILESAIIAGVAAAQTAAVLSRPIPQYASGIESTPRTENALVGERGKEAIIYPDGSVGIANKPTIAMLPRGTEVKNAVDTEKMLQKLSFAAMLPKIMGTEKQEANYTTMLKDIHKTLKVGKHTVNNGMSAKDIYYYKHYNV